MTFFRRALTFLRWLVVRNPVLSWRHHPPFSQGLAFVVILGYALVLIFSGSSSFRLALSTLSPIYYHDQFVEIVLRTDSPGIQSVLEGQELWVRVEREGEPVVTVGSQEKMKLAYDRYQDAYVARWPCPWNAPEGLYQLRLEGVGLPEYFPEVREDRFEIGARSFPRLPAGFGVLTLENTVPLRNLPGPDGVRGGADKMVAWTEYIGADAVYIQGGESSGYDKKLPMDFPWYARTEREIREFGRLCHERGLQFGVYAMCFLVGGPPKFSPDYAYGWDYKGGRLISGLEMKTRRGISITDPRRVRDIVKILKKWRDIEEVDFIGLDYIRPVFGGFELAEDFVVDMGVERPEGWKEWTFQEKMLWLGRMRVIDPEYVNKKQNYSFIEKWLWYRAHRSAQVVRAIKKKIGRRKPLWAFTLSWQKGWQHGQDPVMFRDAGIDVDAIMLYEANDSQFRSLVKHWGKYTDQHQLNLSVGDTFDWDLHQKTLNPAGPEDLYNRTLMAVEGFHRDKPVRSVFFHDIIRAWRGRKGPYPMGEWMLAAGAALTRVRQLHQVLPYEISLDVTREVSPDRSYKVRLALQGKDLPPEVRLEVHGSSDLVFSTTRLTLGPGTPQKTFTLRWKPNEKSEERGNRAFLSIRSLAPQSTDPRAQVYMAYLQGQP